MLSEFERLAKNYPLDTFLFYVDEDGRKQKYTYEELRFRAVALAAYLEQKRVTRNSCVSVDMGNSPEFVVAILAAAYGGFTLAILNHRLTEEEKADRLAELQMVNGIPIALHLDEQKINAMLGEMEYFKNPTPEKRLNLFAKKPKKVKGFDASSDVRLATEREFIHFAEKGTAVFDESSIALIMFTSGTTGRPKAVPLTWGNIIGAAFASNKRLNADRRGFWQAALPLYHIGGFQVIIRSILNETSVALYRRFIPTQILADIETFDATHISVVDKMLQDLMHADEAGGMERYECVLLGGAALNPVTIVEAVAQRISVYASYGMTETSSQIASTLVDESFDGSLTLLPGYHAQIVTPDERGYGVLAVKGPGVFSSYVNSKAPFTVDGFFLTGDTACMVDGRIKVQERVGDMFVSGGENIYPAEVEDKIKRIPGVSDAFVFGIDDVVWGKRPIAMVERSHQTHEFARTSTLDAILADRLEEESHLFKARTEGSPQLFAAELSSSLEQRLSKLYIPKRVYVLDEFPRTAVGKIDKKTLLNRYDERIEVSEVTLYHVRQKLMKPFVTAKVNMRKRESIIIEVKDGQGRSGLGECVAFSSDWYLPETLADDFKVLEDHLIPLVLNQGYLHPSEVIRCFDECGEAARYPLAKGALEPALWDLYGKICEKPLWQLIGGTQKEQVSGGIMVGVMSIPKTLAAVEEAVANGYTRIKLKIRPGEDVERVRAVRNAHPDVMLVLDANQSYTEKDIDTLKALDTLNIRCIEEPLNPNKKPKVGPEGLFARLKRLQKEITMPICLDESISSPEDAWAALEVQAAPVYALKIGKWGGVQNALDFYHAARAQNAEVWMGGMFETAISKRLHATFETLLGIEIPGDLSSTSSYFTSEISRPPFEITKGNIVLHEPGFETGIGCELNKEELKKVTVGTRRYHLGV